ncbi:MAG: AAA family ATPase [Verrucomicrobiales bacterium]
MSHPENTSPTFSWVAIHQEAARKLLDFRDRQQELVTLLNEMHAEGLPVCMTTDKDEEGNTFPLKEIDPFTFFASFNRGQGDQKRQACWEYLKDKWNLESPVPSDFDGIPLVNPTNSWFIAYSNKRQADDVPALWELFTQAVQGGLAGVLDESFNRCLAVNQTGIGSLTMGLFWMRPDEFVACDKKNLTSATELGFTSKPNDARSYRTWVEALKSKGITNFVNFSHSAHLQMISPPSSQQAVRPDVPDTTSLAAPFDRIFRSVEEANIMLDLALRAFPILGLDQNSADDPRISLTLANYPNHNRMNLNYGGLAGLCFTKEKNGDALFSFGCQIADAPSFAVNEPPQERGPEETWVSNILFEDIERPEFIDSFDSGISHLAEMYASWQGTPYRPRHRPELYEVFYKRSLLSTGIDLDLSKTDRKLAPTKNLDELLDIPSYTREEALTEIFMPEEQLNDILAQLERKKNIILQGAPGVGKTFIAKRLAWLQMKCKDKKRVQTVQFHQSYTYEDFIQGLRPRKEGGFEIKNGIFYRLCKQAERDPDQDYFLVIDEINRGNLSKILGELMMLIETDKRGSEKATLLYSEGESFTVPENLYLIGTMNTADRSLSLVDYALRRRFAFLTLKPGFETESFAAHHRQLDVSDEQISKIRGIMAQLNDEIAKDTLNLGEGFCIGHSFFTPNDDDLKVGFDAWLESVLRYEIAPLLEEYWIDDPEKAEGHKKALLGS